MFVSHLQREHRNFYFYFFPLQRLTGQLEDREEQFAEFDKKCM